MSDAAIINLIQPDYDGPQDNILGMIQCLYMEKEKDCENHITLVTVYKWYRHTNSVLYKRWELIVDRLYIWYEWIVPVPKNYLVYRSIMNTVHKLHYELQSPSKLVLFMCDNVQKAHIKLYSNIELHRKCIGFLRMFNLNYKLQTEEIYAPQTIPQSSIAIYIKEPYDIPHKAIKYTDSFCLVFVLGVLTLRFNSEFINYIKENYI